jgi:uncharacterized membrane protein
MRLGADWVRVGEVVTYNIVLFIHVLAAIIWIGGTSALQVLVFRAKRTGDGAVLGRMSQESEWLGIRVLLPVSIVLLIGGITLAIIGPYGFSQPFIIVGLSGFACSVVIGSILGPLGKRMKAAVLQHGFDHPEVRQRMGLVFTMSRIELVILIIVVFFMIVKPGTPNS